MSGVLAFWSHALAAAVFATLLLWQLRAGARGGGQRLLLAGLLLTAAWAWLNAIDSRGILAGHAETARNLVWVGLLHALTDATDREENDTRLYGIRLVYAAVAAVLGLQFVVDTLPALGDDPAGAVAITAQILRLTAAAGALVLVHNLYGRAAPASRTSIRLTLIALALMWAYDFALYAMTWLDARVAESLHDWRGAMLVAAAPLFALGGQRAEGWRIRLSRTATFQSLALVAICSFFALTAILVTGLRGTDSNWVRGLLVGLLAAMTVAAMVLLPSERARSWTKVKIAKHLFEHRYDYRAEWLRFTATLGRSGGEALPLAERVIKAFADIVDAPAGLLLAAEEGGGAPVVAASWNWRGRPLPGAPELDAIGSALWPTLGEGRVLELDVARASTSESREAVAPIPAWLMDEPSLWAGIPLIHNDRLVGLVLLAPPELRRALDWEDFDLLRTAGRQAASSLAESHGQQALMNAHRFEEFNRRFAFILHDIKNLVSQLSLLTRNAERHADNPEFRDDMIATLKSSVGKMNDLLTRLAPQGGAAPAPRAMPFPLLGPLSAAIAGKRRSHDVRLIGPASLEVIGDAASLEQAVGHLLQNAIDASRPEAPVLVRVASEGERVAVEVADTGCGMDSDFLRHRLFQPFASTKPGGFGIGAFEARSLVHAMGGQLSVASRPGEGTRFTIHLAAAAAIHEPLAPTRKRA